MPRDGDQVPQLGVQFDMLSRPAKTLRETLGVAATLTLLLPAPLFDTITRWDTDTNPTAARDFV